MTPMPTEQERHQKAFEIYYAQGEKRSHSRLAADLGVAVGTVKLWSRTFNWQQRLRERDATAARQVADQTLRSSTDDLSRSKKLVALALNRLAKAVISGEIKYQLADVDRMIRLQAFLDGHTDGPGRYRTPEEFVAQFMEYFQSLTTAEQDQAIAHCERLEAQRLPPAHPTTGPSTPTPGSDPVSPPSTDAVIPPDPPDQKSSPD
jgi:hypothetical protein